MGEIIFDLLLAIPLAIILTFLLSLAGYLLFGAWGGGAGAIIGLALGLYLDRWLLTRADVATSRRKLSGMMLTLGAVLAVAAIAVATR